MSPFFSSTFSCFFYDELLYILPFHFSFPPFHFRLDSTTSQVFFITVSSILFILSISIYLFYTILSLTFMFFNSLIFMLNDEKNNIATDFFLFSLNILPVYPFSVFQTFSYNLIYAQFTLSFFFHLLTSIYLSLFLNFCIFFISISLHLFFLSPS
ncbi:unnamed protein product [Acanthosepion pharaonis]|uniref:Uncharacterized protein n=1 Tax=Acanthosepion pharaonis TaxID=158019 RepID=A0A812E1D2_ACAPH|nr:unnamed protein product [Sepia pharaonis]